MRFFSVAATVLTLATFSAEAAGTVSPLPLRSQYRSSDYQAIGEAVASSAVVSLGESIHLTREMPLVRLGVLRHLHEQKRFGVLALEGALIDAWTAQENTYRSRDPLAARARAFTRQALFGLWQTDQMEEVIAYALSTQGTENPLYLTSFDIQPGSARSHGGSGENSVRAFLGALRAADPSVGEAQARGWATALGPALNCRAGPAHERSLQSVEQWIAGGASRSLAPQRPRVHIEALRLVPAMLRRRLQHCREVAAGGSYQEMRDRHNAAMARDLLGIAGRLVLWAHHSHVHHNSLGGAVPSMGQHLKRSLGDALYTIGVFASGGAAVDSLRADKAGESAGIVFALASRPLPSDDRFGVERRLAALSRSDFFVDFQRAGPDWSSPSTSRLEVEHSMPTALSKDFDGAILLHEVTGAELNFLPRPLAWAVAVAGWILQNLVLASLLGVALVAAFIALITRLVRRRRRRRAAGAAA